MKGLCVLRCSSNHIHGTVRLSQTSKGLRVVIKINDIPVGDHGVHIFHCGNVTNTNMCSHYNPFGKNHGDVNSEESHSGDLGNITVNTDGHGQKTCTVKNLSLLGENFVLGRSIVVTKKRDDLGLGKHRSSKTNGNSGKGLLWGTIGLNHS